jgi:hypothetical protein
MIMPCIQCSEDIEICGPDASQSDCIDFPHFDILRGDDDPDVTSGEHKCPEGWCFERKCVDTNGKSYSIWRPTDGNCRKHAYTAYRRWHQWHCSCNC